MSCIHLLKGQSTSANDLTHDIPPRYVKSFAKQGISWKCVKQGSDLVLSIAIIIFSC